MTSWSTWMVQSQETCLDGWSFLSQAKGLYMKMRCLQSYCLQSDCGGGVSHTRTSVAGLPEWYKYHSCHHSYRFSEPAAKGRVWDELIDWHAAWTTFGFNDNCGSTVLAMLELGGMNGQTDWQAQHNYNRSKGLTRQSCCDARGSVSTWTDQSLSSSYLIYPVVWLTVGAPL